MTESMSADHPLAVRRRALFDRIIKLPEAFLSRVEAVVGEAEITVRSVEFSREQAGMPSLVGQTRTVAGATITDRPDLTYAVSIAGGPVTEQTANVIRQAPEPELTSAALNGTLAEVYDGKGMNPTTVIPGGPVTVQAPEPEHAAELAKVGGARR